MYSFNNFVVEQKEERMETYIKTFQELSNDELYSLMQLRSEVFVVEQDCVYNDLDGDDKVAMHLLIKDENGNVVAYARMLDKGTRFEQASIGRLVVKKEVRFNSLARRVMAEAKEWMTNNWSVNLIHISAQKYLKGFYSSLGYVAVSDTYLEDGIPHLGMDLNIKN